MISYGFIITSLIVILMPGTGVIYTVSTGICGSKKDSIAAALGCTAGIIPHLLASSIGLSAVFYTSSLIFQVIKMIGVVYLLYLGLGMIRDRSAFKIDEETKENNKIKIIIKGILINLLNPKLTLFFFSFLPQFIADDNTAYFRQLVLLGGVFMVLTFVVFIQYGLLANYFKNLILKSPGLIRRIQQAFGFIFIGLAAKLALSDE